MSGLFLFLISIVPVVWLFLAFCAFRLPGHVACPCGLLITALLAYSLLGTPATALFGAALDGLVFALWPILLAVVAATVLYKYSVATGGMETIKAMLISVSPDKRILVLILAWGFGGFLEGIAGFGVPVLIPGSILVSLGFSPMLSIVACLVANSVPTPYAMIGIPALTLSGVTGLDANLIAFNVAAQLFIPCLILPFFLVMLVGGGVRAVKGVGLITFISGLSFALPLLLVARFVGPELPTLLGSICSIACVALSSKRLYRNDAHNKAYQLSLRGSEGAIGPALPQGPALSPANVVSPLQAFLPFVLVFLLVIVSNAVYSITPGLLIFAAVLLSCLIQGKIPGKRFSLLPAIIVSTLLESKKMAATVITIIAMAKIMDRSGMTEAIAAMLIAVFSVFFPLVAPVIGMLGTFITGSDTTCCILFGSLQASAARAIGVDAAWVASSNLSAAAAGKMISPQSVAIGLRIGGLDGKEGEIIRQAIKYALLCTGIISLVAYGRVLFFG